MKAVLVVIVCFFLGACLQGNNSTSATETANETHAGLDMTQSCAECHDGIGATVFWAIVIAPSVFVQELVLVKA